MAQAIQASVPDRRNLAVRTGYRQFEHEGSMPTILTLMKPSSLGRSGDSVIALPLKRRSSGRHHQDLREKHVGLAKLRPDIRP